MNNNSFIKHIDFLFIDLFCLIISFLSAFKIKIQNPLTINTTVYLNIVLWMLVPIVITAVLNNPYSGIIRRSFIDEIKTSIIFISFDFVFITVLLWALKLGDQFSRIVLSLTYLLYFIISIIIRGLYKKYLINRFKNREIEDYKKIVLVCNSNNVLDIIFNIENAENKEYMISALCLVDGNKNKVHTDYELCKAKNLYKYVIDNNINSVCIFSDIEKIDKNTISKIINEGICVETYISKLYNIDSESKEIGKIGPYDVVKQNSYSFSVSQRIYFVFKRLIDIVLSIFGLLMFCLCFIVIKIVSLLKGDKYPIIYHHTRVGKNGKEFQLYKFRSMVPNADDVLRELLKNNEIRKEWEKDRKIDNDPRITKIGDVLRKTSLDELPQFINVFKGEMSIIGPRPLIPGELKEKDGLLLYEKVKPGITGWWACNGRSSISYEDRLDLEYYYVKNCSLYLDILCVIKTVVIVLTRKGAK